MCDLRRPLVLPAGTVLSSAISAHIEIMNRSSTPFSVVACSRVRVCDSPSSFLPSSTVSVFRLDSASACFCSAVLSSPSSAAAAKGPVASPSLSLRGSDEVSPPSMYELRPRRARVDDEA